MSVLVDGEKLETRAESNVELRVDRIRSLAMTPEPIAALFANGPSHN